MREDGLRVRGAKTGWAFSRGGGHRLVGLNETVMGKDDRKEGREREMKGKISCDGARGEVRPCQEVSAPFRQEVLEEDLATLIPYA